MTEAKDETEVKVKPDAEEKEQNRDNWRNQDLIKDEVYPEHIRTTMNVRVQNAVNDVLSKHIILQPEFQRDYIWSKTQATHLVDSILRNLGIPELWLWEFDTDRFEMLDGQQRLQSLVNVIKGDLEFEGFSGRFRSFNGMKFNQLPANIQETINAYQLQFVCVKNHGNNLSAKQEYYRGGL